MQFSNFFVLSSSILWFFCLSVSTESLLSKGEIFIESLMKKNEIYNLFETASIYGNVHLVEKILTLKEPAILETSPYLFNAIATGNAPLVKVL